MNNTPTSPELPQGEPHPAVRLAEAVCALIAAIAGPSWFWRFLPGGRAFWAGMHQLARDFSALMQRLAAAPPVLPVIAPPRRRRKVLTGEMRPRPVARTRRTRVAKARTRRPATARAPAYCPTSPAPRRPMARVTIALRKRRRRQTGRNESPSRAHIITI